MRINQVTARVTGPEPATAGLGRETEKEDEEDRTPQEREEGEHGEYAETAAEVTVTTSLLSENADGERGAPRGGLCEGLGDPRLPRGRLSRERTRASALALLVSGQEAAGWPGPPAGAPHGTCIQTRAPVTRRARAPRRLGACPALRSAGPASAPWECAGCGLAPGRARSCAPLARADREALVRQRRPQVLEGGARSDGQ